MIREEVIEIHLSSSHAQFTVEPKISKRGAIIRLGAECLIRNRRTKDGLKYRTHKVSAELETHERFTWLESMALEYVAMMILRESSAFRRVRVHFFQRNQPDTMQMG